MTSQIITQGMSAADLDKLDLIADIQFNEPLGSAAINRKFFGVMPEGIYRGFKAAPAGGLTVVVGQDSVNVAVVNVDGFMINVHSLRPIVLDIPVGREVYAIIEANYAIGRRTTQTDINASIKAADLRIINPNELRKNHVIVFTANLPEGTTEIKPEHILTEKRQNASILDDVTDELRKVIYGILETISKKDPFPQYATKDSPALTGKPTSPTPTTDAKGDEIATAKFVLSSIAALVGAAPDVMDTLQEISAALNNNPNFANEIIFQLSGKLSKAECGADIPDKAKFLENLGIKELLEELKKNSGAPILSRDWVPLRTAMWKGYAAADGQLIENGRALYPDAWAAIEGGQVPVCSEAEWLANPSKRGCYTVGDGKTNFRVPDYNGKSAGALGAVVFRGDGKNAAPAGDVQGDAIRNITGSHMHCRIDSMDSATGAFARSDDLAWNGWVTQPVATNPARNMSFDASLVVPTAEENRMVNVAGCWAIRLFGAVQNTGSADAAALATAIAGLSSRAATLDGRVAALEVRKLTCLVNAVGTGAPHETVVAQLPTSVAINSRYVLPNPFGINTPVICRAEILLNGVWTDPSFIFNSLAGGYGTMATYVQGIGVVVQTGNIAVCCDSVHSGNGAGVGDFDLASARCRVFVQKMEV